MITATLAITLLLSTGANADVVNLGASKDGTLFEPLEDKADGGGEYFFVGNTNGGDRRRGVIAFDVTSIPVGSTVNSVTLSLRMSRTQAGTTPVSLHRMLLDWGEGNSCAPGVEDCGQEGGGGAAKQDDVTWPHRFFNEANKDDSIFWTLPGAESDFVGTGSASANVGGNGFYDWDSASNPTLVSDVQGWVDSTISNFGWIVIGQEGTVGNPDSQTAKRFESRQNSNASRRPQLTVDFTPPTESGACCGTTGACSEVTATSCSIAEGVFLGTTETCSPTDPCPTSAGACCSPLDGSCTMVAEPGGACTGGTYQEAGSVCDPNICPPPPTGACCFATASATCTTDTQLSCEGAGGTYQSDLSECTPNPCPVVLTPFLDALPLPAVATPVSGSPGGTATYDMAMREVTQQLHTELANPTTVWGYGDGPIGASYPGPTIEATTDQPVTVNWINDLPDLDHLLTVDTCPHGADDQSRRTVVHLHGAHVPSAFDGHPEDTFTPGQQETYVYPNKQLSTTLWFHDHALGITRLNVYLGLAAFYLIRDAFELGLGLPSGEFEIPLAIQDRSFNPDGSLQYPSVWQDHFFGNTMLVNGKAWPVHDVKQGKYRLRMLNGCNSRTLTLEFCEGSNASPCPSPATVQVLGQEGGLLPAPTPLSQITLGPAERADVVVDFAPYAADTEVFLVNSAPAPFPGTPGEGVVSDVMKFVVQGVPGDFTGPLPATLRPIEVLQETDAVAFRSFELTKASEATCGAGIVWEVVTTDGLNGAALGKKWVDITEFPELGTTEVWGFINRSGITHPMHMHLVMFQVLDRQAFDVVGGEVVPIGSPVPPPTHEAGWKDTVQVGPNEIVRVIARFENYTGKFPYHCHILEHEDHEMMREFVAIQCGNSVLEPTEECDDGNKKAGDGCYTTCDLEDELLLFGEAEGGMVDVTVDGVLVSVPTTAGQTLAQVTAAVADAITNDATLAGQGVSAVAIGNRIVTNGTIGDVFITDPGLSEFPVIPVPALSGWALGGLTAILALAGLAALRRARRFA
jgi:spore coat protein A